MITITNQKIAGFIPSWADFRGYSLLFDNPGQCLTASGSLLALDCSVDNDTQLSFYRELSTSLTSIGREMLIRSYLFCPLPAASYHVTVWDGGNIANLADITPDHQSELKSYLDRLPLSLSNKNHLTDVVLASPLTNYEGEIVFQFDRLVKWGNSVMVVKLKPSTQTEAQFQFLLELRRNLSAEFAKVSGLRPSAQYTPHVSLGYFANQEAAQQATPCIEQWSEVIRESLGDLQLSFRTISLYGFTDIAHFFKAGGNNQK